jgi:predicted AAA+ superfamily ATPase
MKLSEMVEILESNPKLKQKMVNDCIVYFGTENIQTIKKKQQKTEMKEEKWWQGIVSSDSPNYSLEIYDIITTLGIKEYNEKKVAEYLIQGYSGRAITRELRMRHKKLKRIKDNIYDKVKQARKENKI